MHRSANSNDSSDTLVLKDFLETGIFVTQYELVDK